jgi:autotransporter adhesin
MIGTPKLFLIGSVATVAFALPSIGFAQSISNPASQVESTCVEGGTFSTIGEMACGSLAKTTGSSGTAIGAGSIASIDSTALGSGSIASGQNGTAIGRISWALDTNTTATGARSSAIGDGSSAFCSRAFAGSDVAFDDDGGLSAFPSLKNARATAIGAAARAGATAAGQEDATAVGADATANALNASAFGADSKANFANSVALGKGSETDRASSVSVGKAGEERQITYVADGTQATDAVNKRELDAVAVAAATAQGTADLARTEAAAALLAAQDGTQAASALEPAPMTAALPFPPRSSAASATMLSSG